MRLFLCLSLFLVVYMVYIKTTHVVYVFCMREHIKHTQTQLKLFGHCICLLVSPILFCNHFIFSEANRVKVIFVPCVVCINLLRYVTEKSYWEAKKGGQPVFKQT